MDPAFLLPATTWTRQSNPAAVGAAILLGLLVLGVVALLLRERGVPGEARLVRGRRVALAGLGACALVHLLCLPVAWEGAEMLERLGPQASLKDTLITPGRVLEGAVLGGLLLLLSLGAAWLVGAGSGRAGAPLRGGLFLGAVALLLTLGGRPTALADAFEARWGRLAAPMVEPASPYWMEALALGRISRPADLSSIPGFLLTGLSPLFGLLLLPAGAAAIAGLRALTRGGGGGATGALHPGGRAGLAVAAAAVGVAVVRLELLALERCWVVVHWGPRAPDPPLLVEDLLREGWSALAVAWLAGSVLALGLLDRRRGRSRPPAPPVLH
ncbi:MAG: hypothetical protein L6R43_09570 [Planctomycetes bacterium]|nr:hypothetical protein [Planctomycetota bacterium]